MYPESEIQKIILEPVAVRSRGRYRAVVHTGHTYDKHGNISKFGDVLRETPWGKNVITRKGFEQILANQANSNTMIAGAGNTTPTELDGTLASYLGKSSTTATNATTRNVVPDINDEVWWRNTSRITFAPGSLGGGSVNVAEAGMVFNVAVGSVTSSSPIGSRGLLIDGGGLPTTVSVNNAVEYLDIIWEYTEWVKASVTGVVNLVIDGVPTDFDYEVRPHYFDNVGGSYNYGGWQNAASMAIPGYSPNASKAGYPRSWATAAFTGPIGAITGNALGTANTSDIPTAMATDTYVANSKQRTFRCTWLPTEANLVGGIGAIRINLGHSCWQISFDAKIAKIATKQLDVYFTYAMANR